jgi:hypothetical protein
VSIGYRNDWADEQRLDLGPAAFARAMAGAGAVVTIFFHGCVFALLNGKPFVCAGSAYRSNKITALTTSLGAGRHLVTEATPAADYRELLKNPLSPEIPHRISRLRAQSGRYLDAVLA